MPDKQNEIEFFSYGKERERVGSVWWTGKKVESDSPVLLARLKDTTIKGLTISDGVKFLDELPARFRSYLTAVKV